MKLDADFNFTDDNGNLIDPRTAIRELRKKYNWSTRNMAEICGVSSRSVEDWEQGRRKPSNPVRMLLKKYL